MALWVIFALAYLVFAAGIAGFAFYFIHAVLPLAQTGSGEALFASGQIITITALLLIVIAGLFFALARITARPARRLTQAVDAFATRGEQIPVIIPSYAPEEVRQLAVSFINLVKSVQEARARDAEVARVKSDFISTAAHQLRTPLTAVRWALEALGASELTEDQKGLVKNATDKSKDLVNIVGTLLDISAIESGKYKYQMNEMDIGALANEVLIDFKRAADDAGVSLSLELTQGAPAVVADRDRVKWILNNLIENAIRYTPRGGGVKVSLAYARNYVYLSVRDTGIGIPPEERGSIFERFYRGSNAASKENAGNGLGLYIARTIAKDHGGDLNFKSNAEGPGTTFTLSLPVHGPVG